MDIQKVTDCTAEMYCDYCDYGKQRHLANPRYLPLV